MPSDSEGPRIVRQCECECGCITVSILSAKAKGAKSPRLGPTVFWLTCKALNNLIARFERTSAIKIVTERIAADEALRKAHVASHQLYLQSVAEYTGDMHSDFVRAFADESFCSRKFGNAGVGNPEDVKCLHALTAASLGGAYNPIGCALVNYIMFLDSKCGGDAAGGISDFLDDFLNFVKFLDGNAPNCYSFVEKNVDTAALCKAARRILFLAEGNRLRLRKKRRLN